MLKKVKTAKISRQKSAKQPAAKPDGQVGSGSVLLVGKSIIHAQELTSALKPLKNVSVSNCENAAQVGTMLGAQSLYDVIIFDPEIDLGLAAKLRSVVTNKDAPFIVAYSATWSNSAGKRLEAMTETGACNMVTFDPDSVAKVVNIIGSRPKSGDLTCPFCQAKGFYEDDLWTHVPLYHSYARTELKTSCPVTGCDKKQLELAPPHRSRDNFQVHLRNEHGLPMRPDSNVPKETRAPTPVWPFALVVVRNKKGRFLLVQQFAQRGMWVPGGRLGLSEDLNSAAIRIVKEQAGIDVELTGVLRVSYTPQNEFARLRVIFVARPTHEAEKMPLKTVPDYESVSAMWVSSDGLDGLKLYGNEAQEWFPYVARGGYVSPLEVLTPESASAPKL